MATVPGEKKLRILQAIAEMLEQPAGEKVTTAALAARLELSEAALYRHFASKAQMYEGLIEYIETSLFALINRIAEGEEAGLRQAELLTASLLRFAQKNHGLTRVLVGDALVHEHPRLQSRVNQLMARIETTLKQCLKVAAAQGALPPEHDFAAHAEILTTYVAGRWLRFVKSGFGDDPLAGWPAQWQLLGS
jgi:TetR/AcrR family transcriptional regulator